ncbi:MAG: calcium/sodium antiporter [Nitrospirota bacterium]|nr:calcium/sodium antiporter [Nitrospirota bacterium]
MTDSLWIPAGGLVSGLALLAWSAERFVEGAAAVARNLDVSPLLVGLLVVGFGTSAPEIVVSAIAALDGRPDIAIGNAVGSNIVNVGLVLGVAALIRPLFAHSGLLRRELPYTLGAAVLALVLLSDGVLSRTDAMVLLVTFVAMGLWMLGQDDHDRAGIEDAMSAEFAAEMPPPMSTERAATWLVAGLLLMVIASRVLVWGAEAIAHAFGISDLIIGLTVVALGTSLPELATAISAARKGHSDIVIGNVLGSNMVNILAVIGVAGLIHPGAFEARVLTRDFPAMLVFTVALFLMAFSFRGHGRIDRLEGALLIAALIGYLGLLYADGG